MGLQLISCAPKLNMTVRAEKTNYTPKGDVSGVDRALVVQFQPAGNVAEHLRRQVETLPSFRSGIGRDEDPFETRIGWWDSIAAQAEYGWSDEDREFAEKRVLEIADPNVLVVEEVKVLAPYGKYDQHRKTQGKRTLDHVLADITQTYELAGFDVGLAKAYEVQNLNDPKVLAALDGLVATDSVESEELIRA